ncbi:type 2 periplasmic-binding domain-containing protein [Cellvibrio mixtus]|uniref:hypothetical protein n=1 Tax=Cellvibrio mixtus TaxID=39650 RepID=UPI000587F8EF|nr:hypothetical protein [Cellvibrio mixtus]
MFFGVFIVRAIFIMSLLVAIIAVHAYAQAPAGTSARIVKVAAAKPEFAIAQDYFVQLLHKALERGANGRPVPVIQEAQLMEQYVGVQEMIRGKKVDVYWMGTDQERERKLRAIRIPLDRGLIGHRRFIIQQRMQGAFDGVADLTALRAYSACQGIDWPDTKVLRNAGLQVREITSFERIFQELATLRCEYFPRGYFEGYSEIEQRKAIYPELIFYENLVLNYPFALYFFVNTKDEELARWIEAGLEKMIDSGEFVKHMQSHPLTRVAFPLHKVKKLRWINIDNPEMPVGTDYKNSRYWFQPEDFQAPR